MESSDSTNGLRQGGMHVGGPTAEEGLIVDARSTQRPSELIDRKLRTLLGRDAPASPRRFDRRTAAYVPPHS